jgi:YggT family protein
MISGNFVLSAANIIHYIIQVYIIIIIVRSLLSWMGNIPPSQFTYILRRLTDPVFRFVHRRLPFTIIGGFDIAPIIIVLVLYFLDSFLTGVLVDYAMRLKLEGVKL